jgi:hypothetical protein
MTTNQESIAYEHVLLNGFLIGDGRFLVEHNASYCWTQNFTLRGNMILASLIPLAKGEEHVTEPRQFSSKGFCSASGD